MRRPRSDKQRRAVLCCAMPRHAVPRNAAVMCYAKLRPGFATSRDIMPWYATLCYVMPSPPHARGCHAMARHAILRLALRSSPATVSPAR
eukprot:8066622-Pyramimonas_sp.AAC.1